MVLAGSKFKFLSWNSSKVSGRFSNNLLRFLGAPVEQSVKLNIPRKTKLFVDQTFRERENAIRMYIVYSFYNEWFDLTLELFFKVALKILLKIFGDEFLISNNYNQ